MKKGITEEQIRYDSIVQTDLTVDENFDDKAYREFLKMGGISEVLPKNDILKNLGSLRL